MAKMIKCKSCGAEIAKTAKFCPNCGARQHVVALSICAVITVITIIGIIAIIVGSGDTPEKVGEHNSSALSTSSASPSAPSEQTVFGVGDIVEMNDIKVTFVSCTESNGTRYYSPADGNVYVFCEFIIENDSTADIAVSSLLSFSAYVDDYATTMSLTGTLAADNGQLDGTIAAGKKMSGTIGYEVQKDWEEIEVRFKPDFWGGKSFKFAATR